jgi:hypothetical protein
VDVVVGDDVPEPEEEVVLGGDGRRGLRKRNCLDLGKSLHFRWHWHSKDWAGPGCLGAPSDRSTPVLNDYCACGVRRALLTIYRRAGYAEGPQAVAGGLPHQLSSRAVAAQKDNRKATQSTSTITITTKAAASKGVTGKLLKQ